MCAAQKTSVVTTTTAKKFHSLYRNAGAPATSVAMTMIVPYTVPAIVSDEPASSSRSAREDGLTNRKPAVAIARRLQDGQQVLETVLGWLERGLRDHSGSRSAARRDPRPWQSGAESSNCRANSRHRRSPVRQRSLRRPVAGFRRARNRRPSRHAASQELQDAVLRIRAPV